VSSLSDYDHKDTATGAMYHIAFVSNSALWQSAHCTGGLAAIVSYLRGPWHELDNFLNFRCPPQAAASARPVRPQEF
jgi:hypothetical protein